MKKRKGSTLRLIHPEYSIAFVVILLYTAIILAIPGCGEDSDEPEPTAVTGKVLPLGSGAIIKLVLDDIVVDSADVDPEGNYAFSNLPEGQYSLVIMASGYITHSQTCQVIEGQITEIHTIALEKVPPSAVMVTGKVTDSQTGDPIPDALILVEYEKSGTTTFTYTRGDGRFTVSIQTDLSPAITISKAGYESSELNAEDVDNAEVDLKRTSGYVPPPDGSVGLKVGDFAPDFTLPKLGGGTLSLHDTRGKVVLMDFWATWCGPCKAAIPHLQKFYEKYKSEGLVVLGIDVWEYGGVDAVKRFKDDNKLTYDILLGTDTGVDALYEVTGIPTMWLLDRNGVITWTKRGFGSGREVEIEREIKAALASEQLAEQDVPDVAGEKIAFESKRDGNYEIYVMGADGSNQTRLTYESAEDRAPSWSPDRKKIVFHSKRDGNCEIYVMDADGSNQTRLTRNSACDHAPSWSSDGRRIAFESRRDGNYEIYVMDADGADQTRLTYDPADDLAPSWSADGAKIVFHSKRDGNCEIYVMNADGSNQERLTRNLACDHAPSWSPDGRKLAFESNRDGNCEIYVMDADGSNQERLTRNSVCDHAPSWSSDGREIVFESNRDGNLEIYVMNADGSNQYRLTRHPADDAQPS